MIIFDQLRISDDGKQLYINLHVNDASYFSSIYIESIVVMTSDKVSESTDPFSISEGEGSYVYRKDFEDGVKRVDLVLPGNDMAWTYCKSSLSDELFFVYVKCKSTGQVDPCMEYLPCSLTQLTTVGVTFDEGKFYQMMMNYTKQLADSCNIPQGMIDKILLWNGFKAAVETEHFVPAIDFWKKMLDSGDSTVYKTVKQCGCHG